MRRLFLSALLAMGMGLFFASTPTQAQELPQMPPAAASSDPNACWRGAAQYHGVDVWLLYSIAWVESRMNPVAIGRNKNGSLDLGVMQINTIWLNELARYGISKEQLLDGCTSIYVGAWIMSKNIRSYGYTWRAIGAYNSRNPAIGIAYAQKVYDVHRRITGLPTTYMQESVVSR